jgi:hypothetical protein
MKVKASQNPTTMDPAGQLPAGPLIDLPVDDAPQDEVKGGPDRTYYVGTVNGGVWK